MTRPGLSHIAGASEGRVDIGRGELFVRRFGVAGPHIVVVHGGPDWDHSYLLPYILPIADCAQLTLFDLRGCGRSSTFEDAASYHPDEVVADIAALQDCLGLWPSALLGFSFGGRIALRFADRHPARLDKLILASTTAYTDFQPELDAWPEYQQRRPAVDLMERLREGDATAEFTRSLALDSAALDVYTAAGRAEYTRVLQRVRFSGEWGRAFAEGHLTNVPHGDYVASLVGSALPTLIVHGEKDMRFPVSVARRLHDALPESRLAVLAGAGHMTHIEVPEQWNAAVTDFLC